VSKEIGCPSEDPIEKVWSHSVVMLGVGSCPSKALLGYAIDALGVHDSRDLLVIDHSALLAKGCDNTGPSIGPTAGLVDAPNSCLQTRIRPLPPLRLNSPGIERCPGYTKHSAQNPDAVIDLLRFDEPVYFYRDSFAKKAAAFFKISLSSLRIAFSRRRPRFSASSSFCDCG